MVDKETFVSVNKKDFKWPYSKPVTAKPAQPQVSTKPHNYFVKGPVDAYCHCDGHLYDPLMNRYLKLSEKEKLLHDELLQLNADMADLGNEILDHECDSYDEKMDTTYRIDYTKRGMEPSDYIKLMAAVDSPTGVPVKSPSIGLGNGYRDPTRFRYSTFLRPMIDPCQPVTFSTTPATVQSWFNATTGRTEYQDTIGKVGISITKGRQQYSQPLPSSRCRYGDMNF